MSDRPPDDNEIHCADYWVWLLREKLGEDKFRMIRSTPGLPDKSKKVENIEKVATELALARVDQLRSVVDGWDSTVKGMSYEVACRVYNEFVSGCRTLEDFETRNFSKKENDPNIRPREAYPPDLSLNPLFRTEPIHKLAMEGSLPTTGMIYSPHTREFFDPETTMLYLARIFGTPEIYDRILQGNSKTPNMPAAKNYAMPYHPQMNKMNPNHFETLPQLTAPFTAPQQPQQYQQQMQQQQMEQQQPPQAYQVQQINQPQQQFQEQNQQLQEPPPQYQEPPPPQLQEHVQYQQQQYQQQPQTVHHPQQFQQGFVQQQPDFAQPQQPVPMPYIAYGGPHPMMVPQPMPLPMGMPFIALQQGIQIPQGMSMQPYPIHPMAMPENHFVGQPYQQAYIPNQQQVPQGYQQVPYQHQYRGNYSRMKMPKKNRYETVQKIPAAAYENVNTSSSSSTGTVQQTRSSGSEEEPLPQSEEARNAAFPTLNGQDATASLEIDVAAPQSVSGGTKTTVTTPRKFSDVVSHSAAASAPVSSIPSVQEEQSSSKIESESVPLETSEPTTTSFDPKIPVEISKSDESINTAASVEQSKLIKSVEPVKPTLMKKVEPAKPASPVKTAPPTEPARPAKEAKSVKPTESVKAGKPTEVVEPSKPTNPVDSTQNAASAKTVNSVVPVKSAAPVKVPEKPVHQAIPVKEPVKSSNHVPQATRPAESDGPAPVKEQDVVSSRKNSATIVKVSTSEVTKTTEDLSLSSKPSSSAKLNSRPTTGDSAKENGAPATFSTTSALSVDTSDEKIPTASPTSARTVAEVVQQNLSATPSPATKLVTSAQPSPAVKSNASSSLENSTAIRETSKDSSARGKPTGELNKKGKRDQQPPKPSISYAQMLYPKEKEKKKDDNTPSTASSTSGQSSSSQSQKAPAPTDWHTVKNKKAAEPVIVTSPITDQPFPALPVSQNGQKSSKAPEAVASDNEDVVVDDPEAEKKRQKRRNKRQKTKEANKQQKQEQKQQARQESLARVEKMNGASAVPALETQPEEPAKPAFDRNDLAARRKKRLELQRKSGSQLSENTESKVSPPTSTGATTRTVQSNTGSVFSFLPGGLGANATNASISAGQSAMGAYGLANIQNRSPFSITKNGTNHLPLYLPQQPGLRTNQDGLPGAVVMEQDPNSKTTYVPIVVRPLHPEASTSERNEDPTSSRTVENGEKKSVAVDPSAAMIEQILKFDQDNVLRNLEVPTVEETEILTGIEEMKTMWSRVQRAGNLFAYRALSTTVSEALEGKILDLSIKLLSYNKELTERDIELTEKVGLRMQNPQFKFTNITAGLLNFSKDKSVTSPPGEVREKYKKAATLTQTFLKKSEDLYTRISKHYKFPGVDQ